MCGRFALTLPKDAMLSLFEARDALGQDEALAQPRYNIRPTQRILAASIAPEGERVLSAFRWGLLPHWAKSGKDGPPLINARGESVAQKPAFKAAFAARRCLVPADGFFEWTTLPAPGEKGRPIKQPHWIRPAAERDRPLTFGGVWRIWRGEDGEEIPSLAIVTTAANKAMSSLHDRLPVRIAPEDFATWLEGDEHAASALIRAPNDAFYEHYTVSRRINTGGRNAPDDETLLEPWTETEAPTSDEDQPSLF